MNKIKELKLRAIAFLRGADYSSLAAQQEADAICTELNVLFTEASAENKHDEDITFLAAPTFISGILVLDWVLWGDEHVKKLGWCLAKILESSDKMLLDIKTLTRATNDSVKLIKNDLAKVGNDRMNTMAKAQFTTAVTSITMTCGEIVRVLS